MTMLAREASNSSLNESKASAISALGGRPGSTENETDAASGLQMLNAGGLLQMLNAPAPGGSADASGAGIGVVDQNSPKVASPAAKDGASGSAAADTTITKKRRRASAPAPGAFANAGPKPKRRDSSQATPTSHAPERQHSGSRSSGGPKLERQDSLGLGALLEVAKDDRQPPELYANAAPFVKGPLPGTLPAVPRQISQTIPEMLPGALTDAASCLPRASSNNSFDSQQQNKIVAVAGGPMLKITLTQGQDRSQGWMRANGRSTVAHLELKGLAPEVARLVREVLLTGMRANNPVHAMLRLELLYADTQDPVHLKMHGRFMDKLDLMLPNGSAKNSHEINVNWFTIDTSYGISYHSRESGKAEGSAGSMKEADLRAWKPSEFLEVRKPRVEDPSVVECSVKFSTNITSRAHSKRLFFWRASMVLAGLPGFGVEPVILTARTPEFEYRPRPPQEERPSLREVLTDGKPGDMIVCNGDRLGDAYTEVKMVMWNTNQPSKKVLLPRSRPSKTCYVAHLPLENAGIQSGLCKIHLVNDDAQTEQAEITYGASHEVSPLLALSEAVNVWNTNASAESTTPHPMPPVFQPDATMQAAMMQTLADGQPPAPVLAGVTIKKENGTNGEFDDATNAVPQVIAQPAGGSL